MSQVYQADDRLVLERDGSPYCLVIKKASLGKDDFVLMQQAKGDAVSDDAIVFTSYAAVIGIVRLASGPYLLLATEAEVVGDGPHGSTIYRVTRSNVLPLFTGTPSGRAATDDARYRRMLLYVLSRKRFYFSPSYDLTNSAQRQGVMEPAVKELPRSSRADRRFFWNAAMLKDFIDEALEEWVQPMIQGYVQVCDAVTVPGAPTFNMVFISRRSCRRQGMRFNQRGIDADGNVANYVETEQLLLMAGGALKSYVQVRGSIPLFWTQRPTMRWAPKVAIGKAETAGPLALRSHFTEQLRLYDELTIVNLIDKKKDQKKLGDEYARQVEAMREDKLHYVWFDFHAECRRMQWGNLSKLLHQVDRHFASQGFYAEEGGRVVSLQKGAFRTNCMDNLDRTNVVQSLFARRALLVQLGLPVDDIVLESPHKAFEHVFKNLWANNADALSTLYSGTGALKTDFTRTGKRTKAGAMQDLRNSLMRYYLNNFEDGFHQDAYDLFTGAYTVTPGGSSPFTKPDSNGGAAASRLLLAVFAVAFWPVLSALLGMSDRSLFSAVFLFVFLFFLQFAAVGYFFLKKGLPVGRTMVAKPSLIEHKE
eukprot:PLAT4673.1.p2 GENE.PLAT4673.1~~PLAT4673.1.p2  ORF type:complete len:600 (-),score=342.66 PLAT4673.1:97-1872(-)